MMMLTMHQPYASLVTIGAKPIETRGRSTPHRGPIAIHAAATATTWKRLDAPSLMTERTVIEAVLSAFNVHHPDGSWPTPIVMERGSWILAGSGLDPRIDLGDTILPLGAIIGVANLIDVLPIVDMDDHVDGPHIAPSRHAPGRIVAAWPGVGYHGTGRVVYEHSEWRTRWWDGQEPFGDYTPGRFGWLLDAVTALPEPIPCRARQGGWQTIDPAVAVAIDRQLSGVVGERVGE